MDTKALQDALAALLRDEVSDLAEGVTEVLACGDYDDEDGEGGDAPSLGSVSTYQDAGVLTSDAGLVLRMSDGSEFQLTLVRSA